MVRSSESVRCAVTSRSPTSAIRAAQRSRGPEAPRTWELRPDCAGPATAWGRARIAGNRLRVRSPREETVAAEVRLAQPPRKRVIGSGSQAVEPARRCPQHGGRRRSRSGEGGHTGEAAAETESSDRGQRRGRRRRRRRRRRSQRRRWGQEGSGEEADGTEGRGVAVTTEEDGTGEAGNGTEGAGGKEGAGGEEGGEEAGGAPARGGARGGAGPAGDRECDALAEGIGRPSVGALARGRSAGSVRARACRRRAASSKVSANDGERESQRTFG